MEDTTSAELFDQSQKTNYNMHNKVYIKCSQNCSDHLPTYPNILLRLGEIVHAIRCMLLAEASTPQIHSKLSKPNTRGTSHLCSAAASGTGTTNSILRH